jgi:hypothetical protein
MTDSARVAKVGTFLMELRSDRQCPARLALDLSEKSRRAAREFRVSIGNAP